MTILESHTKTITDQHNTVLRVAYADGECAIGIAYQPSTGRVRIRCLDSTMNLLAALNVTRDLRDWIAGLPPVAPIAEIPA